MVWFRASKEPAPPPSETGDEEEIPVEAPSGDEMRGFAVGRLKNEAGDWRVNLCWSGGTSYSFGPWWARYLADRLNDEADFMDPPPEHQPMTAADLGLQDTP